MCNVLRSDEVHEVRDQGDQTIEPPLHRAHTLVEFGPRHRLRKGGMRVLDAPMNSLDGAYQ